MESWGRTVLSVASQGSHLNPSEPQDALFQGSFSLLKNLGSPLHQGPKHATYKPIVPCPIVHTTFFWRTLPMVMAGSSNSRPCLLLLGLAVK